MHASQCLPAVLENKVKMPSYNRKPPTITSYLPSSVQEPVPILWQTFSPFHQAASALCLLLFYPDLELTSVF